MTTQEPQYTQQQFEDLLAECLDEIMVEDTLKPGEKGDNWIYDDETTWVDDMPVCGGVSPAATGYTGLGTSSWKFARGCDHGLDPVFLADGTQVYASGIYGHRAWDPHMGVYLCSTWATKSRAVIKTLVDWPDFGIPDMDFAAMEAFARGVLDTARKGYTVEVACFGSHGRTGTMLAILDMLTVERPNARESIVRIRQNHCKQAVESIEQEWFLRAFAAHLNGEAIPAMPARPRKPKLALPAGNKGKDEATKTANDKARDKRARKAARPEKAKHNNARRNGGRKGGK